MMCAPAGAGGLLPTLTMRSPRTTTRPGVTICPVRTSSTCAARSTVTAVGDSWADIEGLRPKIRQIHKQVKQHGAYYNAPGLAGHGICAACWLIEPLRRVGESLRACRMSRRDSHGLTTGILRSAQNGKAPILR